MAIQVDPALQAMPQRLQDEFRREVAGSRRGPISDAVLPLNGALIDRQRRINALAEEVSRIRADNERLRAAASQASFCLRTLLPDDADAKMTVRMLVDALKA